MVFDVPAVDAAEGFNQHANISSQRMIPSPSIHPRAFSHTPEAVDPWITIPKVSEAAKLLDLASCSLDRQGEVKGRAWFRVGGCPQAAAMRLDNGPANR